MGKKGLAIIIVALVGISLAFPAGSQARGWRGGWGWYGAGAFVGGVVVGAAIARPWYYRPDPYYVIPPPAVVYTAPPPVFPSNQAYAYPDPAATSPQASTDVHLTDRTSPPGQWVDVPGQTVNGMWVPSHRAWVPNSH